MTAIFKILLLLNSISSCCFITFRFLTNITLFIPQTKKLSMILNKKTAKTKIIHFLKHPQGQDGLLLRLDKIQRILQQQLKNKNL